MRCLTLASGSSGNCTYIEGSSGALLIDAGLSVRETLSRLREAGGREDLLQGVLVTHEHADHVKGLGPLARKLNLPVFATAGTLSRCHDLVANTRHTVKRSAVQCHEEFGLGDFIVEPFAISHDAAEPCGYLVQCGGVTLGYCTDTGVITPGIMKSLARSDAIVLESNHCLEMLRTGPYPEMLKRRIRSSRGHLSNEDCAACIQALGQDILHIRLAHLSEVNNTPEVALRSGRSGLGLFSHEVTLSVASETGPSPCWSGEIQL